MHIIATFEQSISIEMTITALEQKGMSKDQILAAPLEKRKGQHKLFDTKHRSDEFSLFDISSILGTVLMLLGSIYGYVLKWGPILWGIIGAISGISIGFILKYILVKKQITKQKSSSEVVLIIHCEEHQWEAIQQILWDNDALGISIVLREVQV